MHLVVGHASFESRPQAQYGFAGNRGSVEDEEEEDDEEDEEEEDCEEAGLV